MAEELERIYTVPLRNSRLAPRYKRAPRAVSEVRKFLARHMKADEEKVWIDGPVNATLWGRGIEKPPSRIRVRAIRFDDGVVEVSLPDSDVMAKRQAIQDEQQRVAEARAAAAAAAAGEEEEETEEEEQPAAEEAPEEEAAPAAESEGESESEGEGTEETPSSR